MTPGSPSRAEDGLPSTESENPVSRGLDSRTAREIVGIIHAEDLKAWESLDSELDTIAEVVDVVAEDGGGATQVALMTTEGQRARRKAADSLFNRIEAKGFKYKL